MALTRQKIVDTALDILRSYGLADLSMRRLARDLGVQPGALYWHVKNKQELLVVLAERILEPVKVGDAGGDPDGAVRRSAQDLRAALLAVRDGSDVVSLAQAAGAGVPHPAGRTDRALDGQWTERTARALGREEPDALHPRRGGRGADPWPSLPDPACWNRILISTLTAKRFCSASIRCSRGWRCIGHGDPIPVSGSDGLSGFLCSLLPITRRNFPVRGGTSRR